MVLCNELVLTTDKPTLLKWIKTEIQLFQNLGHFLRKGTGHLRGKVVANRMTVQTDGSANQGRAGKNLNLPCNVFTIKCFYTEERGSEGMITLTEKATTKVTEVLGEQTDNFVGIRLSVSGGGCSGFQYSMDLERENRQGDQIVEINGFKVFVDEQSLLYLEGTQIDYVENIQGAGFKFNNPNVTGTCGCGESFQA